MASFCMKKVTVIFVMVNVLVKRDEAAYLLSIFNDPSLMASPVVIPIETPLKPASPKAQAPADDPLIPIETPLLKPATPQVPVINTPPNPIVNSPPPIGFPSPIIPSYDNPFPDIPISIPGLGLPRNRHCLPLCSRKCAYYRRRRFAYAKCFGVCAVKCMRPISNIAELNCTQNCVHSKSKSIDDSALDASKELNIVNNCYHDCKKN